MESSARPGLDVQPVDPADTPTLRAVWDVAHAAHDLRPLNTYWPWETFRALQRQPRTDLRTVLLAASRDGHVVGMAELQLYLTDNAHLAAAEVVVHPDHRSRGVGSAVLEVVERAARDDGRTTLLVESFAPPGADSEGLRFGLARGFAVAMEEGLRVCDLAASEASWSALAQAAEPHHLDYRLVTWQGTVPDDLVAAYCELHSVFLDQAPTGDMDIKAERWDEVRVREREARNAAAGRLTFGVVALGPDDDPAGLTEVVLARADPRRADQGVTIVLPHHRGHRLGLAMKIGSYGALRAAEPGCGHVVTDTADSNGPMNAVNEALGFVTVERLLELQKVLT